LTVPDQKSPVLYDARDGGVAVVTLNRPDRLNAWGGGLATEFYRCMDRAEADASQLVVPTASPDCASPSSRPSTAPVPASA
jgi:enoyl-CoA hydratase/carnithine racemase